MPESGSTRALVLGGGGIAGVAWHVGLLSGLAAQGVDVRAADTIIGTSAGSVVATLLRTRPDLEALFEAQLRPVPEDFPAVEFDGLAFFTLLTEAARDGGGQQAVRARLGAAALAADTRSEADGRAAITVEFGGEVDWPAQRLVVTAVDSADGTFRTFDADSGVPLSDAVTASCTIPGVWAPITVGGSRYVDGGMRSATNADVAIGFDRVLVVAPFAGFGNDATGPGLDAEVATLRETAAVHVVLADDAALAAFGANPIDPRIRAAAARAGRAQAETVLAEVGEFWG